MHQIWKKRHRDGCTPPRVHHCFVLDFIRCRRQTRSEIWQLVAAWPLVRSRFPGVLHGDVGGVLYRYTGASSDQWTQ
uniref:Uncharacterized protein n=1 Tax=Hyaloperonospora arabidopsidis (strain Emoy2) TaxID=559515 RepID=M4B3A6_HYAAE